MYIIYTIINAIIGRKAEDIFDFNPKLPIASASIGQVYRATLRETNTTVAVKVQRPGKIIA